MNQIPRAMSDQDDIVLANAQLILPTEVAVGTVALRGGHIQDVALGAHCPAGAVDCGGDFLAPGLIELHTDNLERHLTPRPQAPWPETAALSAHDAELAACGITTVFDAMRVGSVVSGKRGKDYVKYARGMTDVILQARAAGALKISHHLHLRAEICSETLVQELEEFSADDRIGILSLMDHTPGQRQFRDISKLETYLREKYGMNEAAFESHVAHLYGLSRDYRATHEAAAVAAAQRFGAVLASHDDTTPEQVGVSQDYGVRMAEFPTTVDAAQACHDAGIAVIMGAPNLVRGGSHSGNVAAQALAERDLLDIVSSDYVPSALLYSALRLGQLWGDLARGVRTVTDTPARAVGLDDRGALKPGLRADLVRFATFDDVPQLRGVWSNGCRVA